MDKLTIKSKEELKIMAEGGKKLGLVKKALMSAVKIGVSADKIEKLANELIEKQDGKASFKMVKDYEWATCININEGVVHGIPKKSIVFKDGDIVSVDVGMFYRGFHTDTSFSTLIGTNKKKQAFLDNGRESLNKAIKQAKVGNKVGDLSKAMQDTLEKYDLEPIRALVGHGIGKNLHEDPMIPCFVSGSISESTKIAEGMVLAIEVMYTQGSEKIKLDKDGWTIVTRDGKLSALFEETVAITKNGPIALTE